MITDLIINVIFSIPYLILSNLQSLDFNFVLPGNFFDILNNLCTGVGYVLPVTKLLPLFIASINISIFRVAWALVIRIKSFIPTMGS